MKRLLNQYISKSPAAAYFVLAALTAGTVAFAQPTDTAVEMTDQSISDKIEDELIADPGVLATKIDVGTNDGITTLSGRVNNLLAKERSARIAEAVKGVRAVINRIQVNPTISRSDTEIRQDIEDALLNDPAADSYEVVAAVDDGVVTLTGTVDSYQEAELVKIVVKGVRGVTEIVDALDVNFQTNRPEIEIREEVARTLRWNEYVDHELIDVTVSDDEVILSGVVGSASEKRLAAADAWVAGVRSVDTTKLIVERWARDNDLRGAKYVIRSEAELRKAVEDALLYDPRVTSFNIDIFVAGSTVTLRGVVDNLKAKRAAEQDAKNTVGVTYVTNRLKVRPEVPLTDLDIAEDVRDALERDPYVERFEITVTVVDGVAHLYGNADTWFEKNRADEVASRVNGVVDVDNYIRLEDQVSYFYDPYVDHDFVYDDEALAGYEERRPLQTDGELKSAIESELWWSPFVNADDVNVAVDNGIATLTGTVGSWSEFRAATDNAYEGGATLVKNDLVIDYE